MIKIILLENEDITKNNSGGISTYIKNILFFLDRENIDHCFAGVRPDLEIARMLYPGTNFISITGKKRSNFNFFISLFFCIRMLPNQKDVIYHLHHPYMILPFLLRKRRCLFVLTLHGRQELSYKHYHNPLFYSLYLILYSIAFRYFDFVIAVNENLAKFYANKYSISNDKLKIIPVPVNLSIFFPGKKPELRRKYGFEEQSRIIIYAGRISFEKNLELLFDSYKILKSQVKDLVLLVVGNGRGKKHLERKIIKDNLQEIKFINFVDQESLAELLNCSDVFALTSIYEGDPMIIKEAIACNLPVVATDAGGVRNVIEGLDGCYLTENDPVEFSECLRKVLLSGKQYDCKNKIEEHSIESILPGILDIYRHLLL